MIGQFAKKNWFQWSEQSYTVSIKVKQKKQICKADN